MPILPDTLPVMKDVLVELDRLGVTSLNLLEFCYPFNQTPVFNQKGYKIKARPFRVFYNYWYAGGLPIARSELECLDLVAFALEAGLQLGVHYCSLENKHTGQIYQQNAGPLPSARHYFSPTDYFLKTAKVFGDDRRKVPRALRGDRRVRRDADHPWLELHVNQIASLKRLDVEVGLSYNVMETRSDGR
jgi:hypothetical protein